MKNNYVSEVKIQQFIPIKKTSFSSIAANLLLTVHKFVTLTF